MNTAEEVWAILRELSKSQKELFQSQEGFSKAQEEFSKAQNELSKAQKQTDRQIKALGQQIGGLGEKFGSFTEGLALPSMEQILRDQFKMDVINPSVRVKRNGHNQEIDVLAYNKDTACVVEVKSHLREEGIEQIKNILNNFKDFFPELGEKRVFGILAAVDANDLQRKRVLNEGIYMARIKDDVFSLDVPVDFKPKFY